MHTVSIKGFKRGKKAALLLTSLLLANVAATGASLQPDTTLIVARPATTAATAQNDTIVIIQSPMTPAPDDIYDDETVVISQQAGDTTVTIIDEPLPYPLRSENVSDDLVRLGDTSHDVGIAEFAVPAAAFTAAALFVRTPKLVQAREYVQQKLSHHGKDKTSCRCRLRPGLRRGEEPA